MTRTAVPTWFFALAVVRRGERFLLIQERKHDGWYLPAGRAEPGETLAEAAIRETLEESGVRARLTGIVRIEHSPTRDGARVRAIFLAEPTGGEAGPTPDSLDARYVTVEEAASMDLRGPDVLEYFRYVAQGGVIAPLSMIDREDAPLLTSGARSSNAAL